MTTTTTMAGPEPAVREILAAGQCSAACLLSALKPERCGCRCNGAWHGAALAALGLPSQAPGASKPRTPGRSRTGGTNHRRRQT